MSFISFKEEIYLCEACTAALLTAYQFVERVKLADERYKSIARVNENKDEMTQPRQRNVFHYIATDDMDMISMDNNKQSNPIEETYELIDVIDEPQDKKPATELERILSDSFQRKRRFPTTSAGKTGKPKDQTTTTTNSSSASTSPPKVVKLNNTRNLNIALPKFVITTDPSTSDDEDFPGTEQNPLIDDDNSPTKRTNRIKTLNISAVVLSREVMENEPLDLQDICASAAGITELTDDDDGTESIYKCKYCPKAYASGHHLMMHTRKVHMCQYCLSVFEKVNDLYKHAKETHKTFECLMCSCKFRSNGNLRQHMRAYHSIFLPAYVSLISVDKKIE